MPWGAAIAAGGAIIGGSMQAGAANDAAKAQQEASDRAIAEQQRQYDTSRGDLSPWRTAGGMAVNKLSDKLGLNSPQYNLDKYGNGIPVDVLENIAKQYGNQAPQVLEALKGASLNDKQGVNGLRVDTADTMDVQRILGGFTPEGGDGELLRKFTVGDFYNDPVTQLGLEFGQNEGRKGLERMSTVNGGTGLRSGATLKALTRFGQDYAGTKAGESYNRFVNDQTNVYNRLAGVAGTGQTAANNTAILGQQSANNIGGIMTAQGNARGAAGIAQGNAYGGAFNTIGNYYNQQQTLDRFFPKTSGGYGMVGEMVPGQYSTSNPQYGGGP